MPIWLRKYTFNEIKKYKEEENKAHNKSISNSNKGEKVANPPMFNPNTLKNRKITYNKK